MTTSQVWRAWAPSNIALIKYMGKKNASRNIPSNSSLSLTLNHFRTVVEFEQASGSNPQPVWDAGLPSRGDTPEARFQKLDLDAKSIDRALTHVARVRERSKEVLGPFGLAVEMRSGLKLRSANTFPEKSGLASSASSFAALTLGTLYSCAKDATQFKALWNANADFKRAIARLSREGSGSSCRSFEGPWVAWHEADAAPAVESTDLRFSEMADIVVLVDAGAKAVGSSEAHRRVAGSPLWHGREERAETRVERVKRALQNQDFREVSQVAWDELWEMHSLFHTAQPPFTYWQPGSVEVLRWFESTKAWEKAIVTMDAGPNVHVLVPKTDVQMWMKTLAEQFPETKLLLDTQGAGAMVD